MKLCCWMGAFSSPALFLLMAVAGVRAFVVQPSTASARCGGTSFARQHAAAAGAARGASRTTCSSGTATTMSASDEEGGGLARGAWASRIVGAAVAGAVAATQGPGSAALAEVGVGEGGLPDGARQFSNFVKVQKDWAALGASVRAQGAGVTPEEWKNIALFLRKVYQLGGDLEFLAGTFPGDKKKSALGLVKSIQKEVQAADGPAREKNTEAFLAAQASVEKKFEDFMELFNDVPSEL